MTDEKLGVMLGQVVRDAILSNGLGMKIADTVSLAVNLTVIKADWVELWGGATYTKTFSPDLTSLQNSLRNRGITKYDYSLPHPWVDWVNSRIGMTPYNHVVWCYDDYLDEHRNILGYPKAIDAMGDEIIGRLACHV